MAGSEQLHAWSGAFGDAYTERCAIDWRSRQQAWQRMLEGLNIASVLEVGCNRAHNLTCIQHVLANGSFAVGVEVNDRAARHAAGAVSQARIVRGAAPNLPFLDHSFDLVFTAGVLIHIPESALRDVLQSIGRLSRHYVLAIEYHAEEDHSILYRGHEQLLWKRNFRGHYSSEFPHWKILREGFWEKADGFDRTHWHLFEKPARALPEQA